MTEIEIFCGSKLCSAAASYGAVLKTKSPDGDEHMYEHSGELGELAKNVADLASIVMALRCVKLDCRDWPIVLYAPPGYASQVVARNDNGEWRTNSRANPETVEEVRELISQFPNLKTKAKAKGAAPDYKRCLELAETCQKEI